MLVSVQLTAAAVDAGATLPQLVEMVRARFADNGPRLNEIVTRLGYRDQDADLYRARWTLRTTPAFFEVTPDFPALTQDRLNSLVPSPERVLDVRYRIDLTGMPPSAFPISFPPLVALPEENP
jgi:hypothetical protein